MNYEYQETFELLPELEGEFNQEMYENELAQELMEIQSEDELEYFLGNLFKSALRGAKTLVNSPLGQKIKGQVVPGLKAYGKQVLPGLGRTIGGHFLGGTGARCGEKLGQMAAQGMGLEFEHASPQDKRFEASRRFIKVAKDASRRIAAYAKSGRPISYSAVNNIILQSGRQWFPSLPATAGGGSYSSASQSHGKWFRQGNRIILQGT